MMHTTPIPLSLKPALLLSVLLVATVAGCIDQSGSECVDGVCTQTAKPGDAFLTNATRPTAQYGGCHGGYLGLDVPKSLLDGHLPPEFTPVSLVPDGANVRIRAIECPRAEVDGIISEPLRLVFTAVAASPAEPGWQEVGIPSQYVFEVFVNDDEVVSVLREWGLPASVGNITIEQSGTGPVAMDQWSVVTTSTTYEFSLTRVEGDGGSFTSPFVLWAGSETFARVDSNYTTGQAQVAGLGPSHLTMTGDARVADIIGLSDALVSQQAWRSYSDEWRPYHQNFSRT